MIIHKVPASSFPNEFMDYIFVETMGYFPTQRGSISENPNLFREVLITRERLKDKHNHLT